jgi:hypothetical protein
MYKPCTDLTRANALNSIVEQVAPLVVKEDPFVGPPSKGGHGPTAYVKGRRTDCTRLLCGGRPVRWPSPQLVGRADERIAPACYVTMLRFYRKRPTNGLHLLVVWRKPDERIASPAQPAHAHQLTSQSLGCGLRV